jgi:hypothetical protein
MPESPRAFTLSLEFCGKNGYNQKHRRIPLYETLSRSSVAVHDVDGFRLGG